VPPCATTRPGLWPEDDEVQGGLIHAIELLHERNREALLRLGLDPMGLN
jgi:hypothetical protein